MKFNTFNSKMIYQGRAFNVYQDDVELPDGRQLQLDIVDHAPAVTIIPVDYQRNIWFVRQYRYPARKVLLELPAGVMEAGEIPESSAQRELREEIGMAAKSLEKIGGCYLAPGYSTEYMHLYLATNLFPEPMPGDPDEFLQVEKIPLQQVRSMIDAGDIQDAKTLAAFCVARQRLSKIDRMAP